MRWGCSPIAPPFPPPMHAATVKSLYMTSYVTWHEKTVGLCTQNTPLRIITTL